MLAVQNWWPNIQETLGYANEYLKVFLNPEKGNQILAN